MLCWPQLIRKTSQNKLNVIKIYDSVFLWDVCGPHLEGHMRSSGRVFKTPDLDWTIVKLGYNKLSGTGRIKYFQVFS